MKQDMIVILDLGSEENPRLAREIRALGVYSEIHPTISPLEAHGHQRVGIISERPKVLEIQGLLAA